jgi:hypothetical protein
MAEHAPIDPVEWDLAAGQLDELAHAHAGEPWPAWKEAVAEWHLQALAAARAQAWLPGMAGAQDPVVEEFLARFYRHHVRVAISRLRMENIELRRRMLDALECARFYAGGASDGGRHAADVLHAHHLSPPSAAIAHQRAKERASH